MKVWRFNKIKMILNNNIKLLLNCSKNLDFYILMNIL